MNREPQPGAYSSSGLTLRAAARIFVGTFSAKALFPLVGLVLAARIAIGGWRWADLVAVGIVAVAQPFTEWVLHVTVLHWRPKQVGGHTFDPLVARRHRQHHRDPKVIGLVLVPRSVLAALVVQTALIDWLIAPTWRVALTAAAMSYLILVTYEWTHFLIHSSYRPRGWYYRSIHRSHRLHHFRNENYWFGVTINVADHVLRTFPEKERVPVSATAATLGVE